MPKMMPPQRGTRSAGTGPTGRPGLVPAEPMPVWKALVQVAVLLGIPLTLLVLAKLVLRHYFPELGY